MSSRQGYEGEIRQRKMVPRITRDDSLDSNDLGTRREIKATTTYNPWEDSPTRTDSMPEEIPLTDFSDGTLGQLKSLSGDGTNSLSEHNVDLTTDVTAPLLSSQDDDIDGDLIVNKDEASEVKTVSEEDESALSIGLQVFIPYIIAGFGTVGAGMVLDIVQVKISFFPFLF